MITDDQIDEAFDGTNFGPVVESNKRKHVALWVLKTGMGWHCGHTAVNVMLDLGLVSGGKRRVTEKGRRFCFDFFSDATADTAPKEPQITELLEMLHTATEALHCVVDSGARLDQRIMDRITAALEKAGDPA